MKTCPHCDQTKPLDDFPVRSRYEDGHHYICRPCTQKYHREWYLAHQSEVIQKVKKRAAANPQVVRDRVKKWRANNPERAKENHRRSKAQRLERERAAGVGTIEVDTELTWDQQSGVCPCGLPIDRRLKGPDPMAPSLDHIIPLARGGLHTQENVQWMHLRCNVLKGVS